MKRFSQVVMCLALLSALDGCSGTPPTFDGLWIGKDGGSREPHVRSVSISKNEFPCGGTVKFASGSTDFSMDVIWDRKDEELVGTFDNSRGSLGKGQKQEEVIRAKLSGSKLAGSISGTVVSAMTGRNEVPFSGLVKGKED